MKTAEKHMNADVAGSLYPIIVVGLSVVLALTAVLSCFATPVKSQESPTGKIVYIGTDENVWIVNADGTDAQQMTTDADGINLAYDRLGWSLDGQEIVFSSGRLVGDFELEGDLDKWVDATTDWIMSIDGTGKRERDAIDEGTLSPDGLSIAYAVPSGSGAQLYLLDVTSGIATRLFDGHTIGDAWFSPSGDRVGFWGKAQPEGPDTLYVVQNDGGGLERLMEYEASLGRTCGAFARNGEAMFAMPAGTEQVFLIDIASGHITELPYTGVAKCPWLSVQEDAIAFLREVLDPVGLEIVVVDFSGVELGRVMLRNESDTLPSSLVAPGTPRDIVVNTVIPVPNGKHIYCSWYVGGGFYSGGIFDLESGMLSKAFEGRERVDFAPAFSPDGKYVAIGGHTVVVSSSDGSGTPHEIAQGRGLRNVSWQPATFVPESYDARNKVVSIIPTIDFPSTLDGPIPVTSFTGEIRGTAPPNALVRIYRQSDLSTESGPDGLEIGSVHSDDAGNWVIEDVALPPGDSRFWVLAETEGGVVGPSVALQVVMPLPSTSVLELPVLTRAPSTPQTGLLRDGVSLSLFLAIYLIIGAAIGLVFWRRSNPAVRDHRVSAGSAMLGSEPSMSLSTLSAKTPSLGSPVSEGGIPELPALPCQQNTTANRSFLLPTLLIFAIVSVLVGVFVWRFLGSRDKR